MLPVLGSSSGHEPAAPTWTLLSLWQDAEPSQGNGSCGSHYFVRATARSRCPAVTHTLGSHHLPVCSLKGVGSWGACPVAGAQPRHAGSGMGGGPVETAGGQGTDYLLFRFTKGMVVPEHPHPVP